MKGRIVFAAGLAISAVFLARIFMAVDAGEVGRALGSVNYVWVAASLIFFYWSFYLRSARWGLFFRPHYDFNGRDLFRATMIGFCFNSILPARVGEFVRAWLVGKERKTGMPMALATIVTERIFDGATLMLCLAVSLALLPPIQEEVEIQFWEITLTGSMLKPAIRSIVVISSVLAAGVGIFLFPVAPRVAARAAHALPLVPRAVKGGIVHFIHEVARGFESVRGFRTLAAITAYSILIWMLIAVSTLLLAYGFTGVRMNLFQATALMSLVAVFIVIPAAPGYWGLFEAGVLFSLKVMQIQQDDSIGAAYAIVLHLIQFVPIVVVGLIFAARSHVKLSEIKH